MPVESRPKLSGGTFSLPKALLRKSAPRTPEGSFLVSGSLAILGVVDTRFAMRCDECESMKELRMVDAAWAVLALEASKTVVGAMTSSVWEQAKKSFSRQFGHEADGRMSDILQELERTRIELAHAREAGEANTLLPLIQARWQGRVETLFDLDASAVTRMRAFVEEYAPSIAESNDVISQQVDVRDGGTAFIVGKGTQHVHRA